MRRALMITGLVAVLSAVPALAAPARQFAGPGVALTVAGRMVEHFRIKMYYVCGPIGGQKVTETLKVSGLAITGRGKFRWHFTQGPLVITVTGQIRGRTAVGTADGFGDVGAGSSDCGTGRQSWRASET